ncbi:MAG: hypothetical protein NTX64_09380, partial [Elusimicrobia bacterium]|nr:hypothetical protein [Elusimicrobiota bacterium]
MKKGFAAVVAMLTLLGPECWAGISPGTFAASSSASSKGARCADGSQAARKDCCPESIKETKKLCESAGKKGGTGSQLPKVWLVGLSSDDEAQLAGLTLDQSIICEACKNKFNADPAMKDAYKKAAGQ